MGRADTIAMPPVSLSTAEMERRRRRSGNSVMTEDSAGVRGPRVRQMICKPAPTLCRMCAHLVEGHVGAMQIVEQGANAPQPDFNAFRRPATDATTNVRQKSAVTGGKNAMKNVTTETRRRSMDAVRHASSSSAGMVLRILERTHSKGPVQMISLVVRKSMTISTEALMKLMKHSSPGRMTKSAMRGGAIAIRDPMPVGRTAASRSAAMESLIRGLASNAIPRPVRMEESAPPMRNAETIGVSRAMGTADAALFVVWKDAGTSSWKRRTGKRAMMEGVAAEPEIHAASIRRMR